VSQLAKPDEQRMNCDLVVIGASAGGVEVLKRVAGDLPPDIPAAVCVVLHMGPGSPSALAGILERSGSLPCRFATDREPLRAGMMLVAPPDHHLLIEDAHALLTAAPPEHGHRPSIDMLFRTAAEARGSRVIGVILSGAQDDGADGLAQIKALGGAAIVQSPEDASYSAMPRSALARVDADAVVPAARVGETIAAIVSGLRPAERAGARAPSAPGD
jgi:two-component system chemotaxis response regulator CheB